MVDAAPSSLGAIVPCLVPVAQVVVRFTPTGRVLEGIGSIESPIPRSSIEPESSSEPETSVGSSVHPASMAEAIRNVNATALRGWPMAVVPGDTIGSLL